MTSRSRLATVFTVAALLAGGELLACGDKFLVGSRGTRYQRPKNARAASIVIYANPSAPIGVDTAKTQSFLERQGHRAVIATTLEQISAIVSNGRFDVILAASDVAAAIQQLVAKAPGAAVVLTVEKHPRAAKLLSAIDKAVEQRDHELRNKRSSS